MLNRNFTQNFSLFITWMTIIRVTELAHFNVQSHGRKVQLIWPPKIIRFYKPLREVFTILKTAL